jgi:hypothetical protein
VFGSLLLAAVGGGSVILEALDAGSGRSQPSSIAPMTVATANAGNLR